MHFHWYSKKFMKNMGANPIPDYSVRWKRCRCGKSKPARFWL